MMARGSKPSDEELSLYSQWLNQLLEFDNTRTASKEVHAKLTRLQAKIGDGTEDAPITEKQAKRMQTTRDELYRKTREELRSLDQVLESLDILLAMRQAKDVSDSVNVTKMTTGSRKGRNLDEAPSSPSSVATSLSDISGTDFSKDSEILLSKNANEANVNSSNSKKAKRETVVQNYVLPLKAGRRVAFRQPKKTSASGPHSASTPLAQIVRNDGPNVSHNDLGSGKDATWILASVVKCIQGDRNRYIVKDDDPDEGDLPPDEQPIYNTTLKALLPLPTAEEPGPILKSGTLVYALYPDTSCFYRAKVVSGPQHSSDGKRYRVQFEDDNEEVRIVKWDMIVECR